jgi:hypothetical protein
VARIEGQKVASVTLSEVKADLGSHLQAAWKQLLDEDEWILRKVGTVTLQSVGLVPTEGGIRIKDCIEAFLRYTDKPMVASRDAVVQGLAQACKEGVVGIARGVSLAKLQAKWCGEPVDIDPAEDGLWVIPPFAKEEKPGTTGEKESGEAELDTTGKKKGPTITDKGGGDSTSDNGGVKVAKQVRRVTIKGDVPMESWADVFRCFVNPAVRLSPKQLRLGIDFEIDLSAPLAEDHSTLKAMREAARQFGLELEEE